MDEIKIKDKRSMLEIDKIIKFCSQLVLKDERKAEESETIESMSNGYKFLNAMLKADTLENYTITTADLYDMKTVNDTFGYFNRSSFNPDLINPNKIPDDFKNYILELKRFKLYSSYMKQGDYNSYYEKIYQIYIKENETIIQNYDEFIKNKDLPFYAAARLYRNFSILYYPSNIFESNEVVKFKQAYSLSLNYFIKTCYNEAYKAGNPKYDDLCKLIIIFMAINRYLNTRLENIDDIDFFDEYSIRNLFLSYGLDYFFDFPLKYQKRVLKNINFLIKNKGTTKAFMNVLSIFGFDNIKIMKYVLCKEYEHDKDGKIQWDKPQLYFYGIDSSINKIEDGLRDTNTTRIDYDTFIVNDKYWQITPEEKIQLLKESFNYVYSKYISIESFMDLTKYGCDFSYISNYLNYIEELYRNENAGFKNLNFYNYKITSEPINLLDGLNLMYVLIMRRFHYKDVIVKSPTGLCKVYDFNFGTLYDDIKYFTEKYIKTDLIEKEYFYYTYYLLYYKLDPFNERKDEIEKLKQDKIKYRNKDLAKEEYDKIKKNYKLRDSLIETCKEYVIGNISETLFENYLKENDVNIPKIRVLFNYFTYDFLTNDIKEDNYIKFLNQYSVDKNIVLINYLIQEFLNYKITEEEFYNYIRLYDLNITDSIDFDEIKTIKENFKAGFIEDERYKEFMNQYKIEDIDVYNTAEGFVNGTVSDRQFRIKMEEKKLETKTVLFNYLTYKYLDEEFSKSNYLSEISYYNLNKNNIYDLTEITKTKELFKSNQLSETDYNLFKEKYKLDILVQATVQSYFNKGITEEEFEDFIVQNNLSRDNVCFKYLTYNFLQIDNIELHYFDLIDYYNLDKALSTMVRDFKLKYYNGQISKDEYNKYIEKYNVECKLVYSNNRYLTEKAVKEFKKDNMTYIDYTKTINLETFIELFKSNKKFKQSLENKILKENEYDMCKKYKTLHYCSCLGNLRNNLYGNNKTFYDYLKKVNEDLTTFIDNAENAAQITPVDRDAIYNEYILEISNSLETYLESDEFSFIIQGNVILNEYIKDFVYQMIDFIKSYTIEIRDIETIITFDDKFLNTVLLFDEIPSEDSNKMLSDAFVLEDKFGNKDNIILTPELMCKYQDFMRYKTQIIFDKDKIQISEETREMITNLAFSEILTIQDKTVTNQLFSLIENFMKLDDNKEINSELKYIENIKIFYKILRQQQLAHSDTFILNSEYNTFNNEILMENFNSFDSSKIDDTGFTFNEKSKVFDQYNYTNLEKITTPFSFSEKFNMSHLNDSIFNFQISYDDAIYYFSKLPKIIHFEDLKFTCLKEENSTKCVFDLSLLLKGMFYLRSIKTPVLYKSNIVDYCIDENGDKYTYTIIDPAKQEFTIQKIMGKKVKFIYFK